MIQSIISATGWRYAYAIGTNLFYSPVPCFALRADGVVEAMVHDADAVGHMDSPSNQLGLVLVSSLKTKHHISRIVPPGFNAERTNNQLTLTPVA